jgi:hypothetical protein
MSKSIKMRQFMQSLFDDQPTARQAAEFGEAILAAQSMRLTEIAAKMHGSSADSCQRIQCFLKAADPRTAPWRVL